MLTSYGDAKVKDILSAYPLLPIVNNGTDRRATILNIVAMVINTVEPVSLLEPLYPFLNLCVLSCSRKPSISCALSPCSDIFILILQPPSQVVNIYSLTSSILTSQLNASVVSQVVQLGH